MNIKETVNIGKENNAKQFAIAGIRAMGVCMSLTSNEHPITRINGLVLAIAPSGNAREISLLISVSGWLIAKNKKKAFLQRALSLGITMIGTNIVKNS